MTAAEALANLPLFLRFSAEDRAAVAGCVTRATYAEGETIVREGDPGDRLFFLVEGTVEVFRVRGEVDDTLALVSEGNTIGEMTFLDGDARSASARAASAVTAYEMTRAAYARLRDERPDAAARLLDAILRVLAVRLRDADESLAALYAAVREL